MINRGGRSLCDYDHTYATSQNPGLTGLDATPLALILQCWMRRRRSASVRSTVEAALLHNLSATADARG